MKHVTKTSTDDEKGWQTELFSLFGGLTAAHLMISWTRHLIFMIF